MLLLTYFHGLVLQVYHAENKCKPLNLAILLNDWRKARTGAVTTTHDDNNQDTSRTGAITTHDNNQATGLALNLISEISEVVCSQLHSGIMKAARKVLLDEIVGSIISDSLATKRMQKNPKIVPVIESEKSFSSHGRDIGTQTSKKNEMQPENPDEDYAIGDEVEVQHTVDNERYYGVETMRPPPSMKSVGSFENFCAAYTVVSRTIFCSCLEVMWNAICYDPVADYSSAWRKKKRWYSPDYVVGQTIPYKEYTQQIKKLPANFVCIDICHIFWF